LQLVLNLHKHFYQLDALRKFPLVAGDRVVVTKDSRIIQLAHLKNTLFSDRLVAKFKLPVEGWRGE
jgi:NAD+ kinase